MEDDKLTKVSVKQRLFLAIAVAVLLVLGVLLFAMNYSNLWSGKGASNGVSGSQNQAVDLQKMASDYKRDFSATMNAYLASDSGSSQFLQATQDTRDKLLAMRVPAAYRDAHLSSVLILDNISRLISSGQNSKIKAELDKLKKIANQL